MASPTGIIPEALMSSENEREVVDLLKRLPLDFAVKRGLLLGWAQTVGARVTGDLFRELEASSLDK